MDKSTNNYMMDQSPKKVLLLLVLVTFFSAVNCDIRCHCNQPACVRTSYMCKSTGPQAGCFVEHSPPGFGLNVDQAISRHGCIEMLPIEQRTPCLEQALASFAASQSADSKQSSQQHHRHGHGRMGLSSSSSGATSQHQRPFNKSIMCCLDDMCNYIKNDDQGGSSSSSSSSHHHSNRHHNRHLDSTSNRVDNSEDIDELGKHLQQDFNRGLPNYESQSTLIFAMIISGLILIMFIFLVLFVLFVMRYIRQQNPQHMKQTQLSTVDCHSFGPAKKSMLDWRCFKPAKGGAGSPNLYDSARSFNNSMYSSNAKSMTHQQYLNQKQAQQAKHSLLLSVKVDVDSQGLTKLENEDYNSSHQQDVSSNLPNIISAHMMSQQSEQLETELDNRAPMMNNAPKFGRERQNSIYLSLLPPSVPTQQQQQQSQTERGQQNPNFDLIN